jgi:hypothetical protein
VLAVAAVLVAGAAIPGGATKARADDPIVLTVYHNGVWDSQGTLTSGTLVKQYTLTQLEALPAFAGYAGYMNSVGNFTPSTGGPEAVTGVKVLDVLTDAFPGTGLTAQQSVDIQTPDLYPGTHSYDQIANLTGFTMYDWPTKQIMTGLQGPLAAILVYSDPEQHVMPPDHGPLRFMIADQQNEYAMMAGSDSPYNVIGLNVRDFTPQEWQLKLVGLKRNGAKPTRTFSRNHFESCSAPGCHGAAFTVSGQQWTGTPLYLLVGEVDGGRDMTYSAALARKGYRIRLYSASGTSVTISSKVTVRRSSVLVANAVDGAAPVTGLYPLRLVGPPKYVPASKYLGRITKIVMLPMKP